MNERSQRREFEALQVRVRELQERDALVEIPSDVSELERAIAALEASNGQAVARRDALEARRLEAQALHAFNREHAVDHYRSNESENQGLFRWLSVLMGTFATGFIFFKLEQALRPFEPLGLVNLVPVGIGLALFARAQWLRARVPPS